MATLVKTTTETGAATSGPPTQSATLPVATGALSLPQIRAALSRSGLTTPAQMQLAIQKQVLQRQQFTPQQKARLAISQTIKEMPA